MHRHSESQNNLENFSNLVEPHGFQRRTENIISTKKETEKKILINATIHRGNFLY